MKKFLTAVIALFLLTAVPSLTHKAEAQITRQITIAAADDTLTNTDTAVVSLTFDGSWKSVEGWVKEVSGTTGGKVYFRGEYLHGSDYALLDSLTLSDVTTAQYHLFTVPNPRLYKSFNLQYLHVGTGVMEIKAYYVRYTGGAIMHIDQSSGLANVFKPGNKMRDLSKPIIALNLITGNNTEIIVGRLRLSNDRRNRTAS